MNRKQRIANTSTHANLMLYLLLLDGMPLWQRRLFRQLALRHRRRP